MIIKVSFSVSEILPYSDSIDNMLSIISVGCFVLYIFETSSLSLGLVLYSLIVLLALYSSIRVNNNELLITAVTCFAIRNEDMDKIFSFIYIYELYFFILHTVYAVLRYVFIHESLCTEIDGLIRYHFGMGHPNRFSVYLFNLILLWLFLNFKYITKSNLLVIFGISMISYVFTKTRTNFITLTVLLVLMVIIERISENTDISKIVCRISMFIIPVMAFLTYVCVQMYMKGNAAAYAVDSILSGRIRLGAYAFQKYGFSFLGQAVTNEISYNKEWNLSYFTFDNAYTFLMVSQGFIWLILIIFLVILLSKKSDMRIHYAVIAWALYGITEVHGLNGYMCFPILLTAFIFSGHKYLTEEDQKNAEHDCSD